MPNWARSVLAVLAGLFASVIVIGAVEVVSAGIVSLPAGTDRGDMKAARAAMAMMPVGAFLTVLSGWTLGTFLGSVVAARVARRAPLAHAAAVGTVFLLGAVATMFMLPHPGWFWAISLPAFPLAAYLGARVGSSGPASRKPVPAAYDL